MLTNKSNYFKMSAILLILDAIYLYLTKPYFQHQIKSVQNAPVSIKLGYVFLCYISLTIGLFFFIIRQKKKPFDALLLGLLIYSVYELTNASLFTKWSIYTVLLDSIWGGVLFYLTTFIYYTLFG